MVVIETPAKMHCDWEGPGGCKATAPVHLLLLSTGTLGFRPISPRSEWKIGVHPKSSAYMCRCPEHATAVEVVAPKIELASH